MTDWPRPVEKLVARRIPRIANGLQWAVAFLVPAAFQLLYGVRDVGLVEEWGVQVRFDQIGPVFWTPIEHGGLVAQSIRPMTVAPHSLAYLLDPDSFVWYHILNAIGLGLKGLAMVALLSQLGMRRSIALSGAVVFALFPAWSGLFTFRMIHGQFAIAALVFALSRLLAFYDRPSIQRGLSIAVGLTISLLVYEVGYVVVALAPLLLMVRGRVTLTRFLQTCAVWFIVPLLNGIRIILLFTSGQTLYERDLVTSSARAPGRELIDLLKHVFGDGLGDLLNGPFGMAISISTVCLFLVYLASVLYGAWDEASNQETELPAAFATDRSLLLLTVSALASAPIVTLIYAPHPIHLADPLRIFSIASLPLAIGIAGLVEMVARRQRQVGVSLSILLVGATMSSAAAQREAWHQRSVLQEDALGAIVAAKAAMPEARDIVVIDPGHIVGDEVYSFIPEYLRLSLDYVLPGLGNVLLCRAPVRQLPETAALPTDCSLRDGVVTTYLGSVPLESASVIEIRHTQVGAGWSGFPVDSKWPRVRSVLPCVGEGTCDSGRLGVQARIVETIEPP